MYHYITKEEYFTVLDNEEIDASTQKNYHFGLKHIQDVCVLNKILYLPQGRVAEIGGGVSRTLPILNEKGWECWNVEPFEGAGNGPRTLCSLPGVQHVNAYLGASSHLLGDACFDMVYSVSVIEHVPDADLTAFFQDMFRILKPGGQAWHAIDVYLRDEDDPTVKQRAAAVFTAALDAGFKPIQKEEMPGSRFCCAYATNPDLVMRQWNKSVPALRAKRAISQSVSLILGLNKAK